MVPFWTAGRAAGVRSSCLPCGSQKTDTVARSTSGSGRYVAMSPGSHAGAPNSWLGLMLGLTGRTLVETPRPSSQRPRPVSAPAPDSASC